MPKDKFKIHEIAKDFGLSSKDVIDALSEVSQKERKSSTVLGDSELNLFFEVITQKTQLKNFDPYVAAAKKIMKERQAEKKAKVQDAQKAAEKTEAVPVKEEKAEKAPKTEKTEKAPKAEKGEKSEKAPEKKPEPKKTEKKSEVKAPEKKKEEKKNAPIQSRTKGEKRTVDTRSSNVDLDKYNERYEQIAPADRLSDRSSNKQKIKQKSQQYRKQGMRSSKKETEAERLKRIALERSKKTITIKVPDEISVGDLAALLLRQHCRQ